jgi:hypothetical protein
VLSGSDQLLYDDGPRSYVDWYAAQWQGSSVEIALAPGGYRNGYAIVFTEDAEDASSVRSICRTLPSVPSGVRCATPKAGKAHRN